MKKKNIISIILVGILVILGGYIAYRLTHKKLHQLPGYHKEGAIERKNTKTDKFLEYLLDETVTGEDFKCPDRFEIGGVQFRKYGYSYSVWDDVDDEVTKHPDIPTPALANEFIQAYEYGLCWKNDIIDYFNNNYTKLYESKSNTSEAVHIYIDDTNDARLFIIKGLYLGVFNKYRYVELVEEIRRGREEARERRESIANAGKINF